MSMDQTDKLTWSALEYEEKERSKDWFWALGVIVVTASLASIIYGNYFFAALIIISGLLLGFFAVKKPEIISYELNDHGLKIRNRLYPYENIQSFFIQTSSSRKHKDGQISKPTLFIKSERFFMPIISVPIEDSLAEDIYIIMSTNNIKEEEMVEHVSEKIMESLGF